MLKLKHNTDLGELIIRFEDEELANKTITYTMELIATRLADEFIMKYGVTTLKELGMDEIKKEVAANIEKRLTELGIKQNETS